MQQAQGAASAAQAPPLAGRIGPRANSLRLLHHISGPQSGSPAAGSSGTRPQPGGCDAAGAARGVCRAGPARGGADWAFGSIRCGYYITKPNAFHERMGEKRLKIPVILQKTAKQGSRLCLCEIKRGGIPPLFSEETSIVFSANLEISLRMAADRADFRRRFSIVKMSAVRTVPNLLALPLEHLPAFQVF